MPDIPEVPSAFKGVIEYCLSHEMLDRAIERWRCKGNSKPYAFRYTFSLTKAHKVPEPKMMAWPPKDL